VEEPILTPQPEPETEKKTKEPETVDFWSAAKTVFGLTYNPVIGSFFHPVYSIVNAAVLGHSGNTHELAGLGLGSLTIGLCVISVTSTFVTGSATVISQAYGAGDLKLCTVYRNRQLFLSSCVYFALGIPLLFCGYIFEFIGQDPETAAYATKYVYTVLPSLYFFVIGQCFAIYSCNQTITWIPLFATIAGAAVHALMIYLLYFVADMGFYGVALATASMFMTRFFVNCGLVLNSSSFKKFDDVKLFSK